MWRVRVAGAAIALLATAACGERAAPAGDAHGSTAAVVGADARETGAATGARDDALATAFADTASLARVPAGTPRAALPARIGQPSRRGYEAGATCTYVTGSRLPAGVRIMLVRDSVARVDVTAPGVPTRAGIQVGDPVDLVLARHAGRVTRTPHKYVPGEAYLTVPLAGGERLVFETAEGRVARYRAGRPPEVEWVEGCG